MNDHSNLFLIGYRGSGKTTVAPLVAKLLDRTVFDSDECVETESGISIAEIFAQHGEPEFRKRETAAIKDLSYKTNAVISLGGGAPIFPDNQRLISESGKAVYLSGSLDVLWGRIAGDAKSDDQRPALTDLDGRAEVEQVLTHRAPIYEACADYTIDVDELSPQEIADTIVKWFRQVDK